MACVNACSGAGWVETERVRTEVMRVELIRKKADEGEEGGPQRTAAKKEL
jgi:hypothetical protein